MKPVFLVSASVLLLSTYGCASLTSSTDSQTAVSEDPIQPPPVVAVPLPQKPKTAETPQEPVLEADLWHRIRAGFELQDYAHPKMDQYVRWYSSHPEYIERVFNRGERYLYHIVGRIEAEGLPLEIALMPVVESAFDPFAYSHATATGMWQFMAGTGSDYGLKQNWWYDGRRDVIDSTDAAITHLKRLHALFDGDWLLALAAYNTGQGRLMRSIKRNKRAGKPTDFWSLELPRETRAYVPQLLALSKVINEPSAYNIALPELANAPYFVSVDIDSQLDLAQAAELAGISMDELYLLNPGFNRWATDPEGPHRLNIPVAKQADFNQGLAAIPTESRISWQRYTIRSGDSLIKIARQFNTSAEALQTANNLRSSRIRAGDTLLIPKASANGAHYAFSAPQRLAKTQEKSKGAAGSQKIMYTVRKGDSFWRIANQHKVSVSSLTRWNGMAPRETLKPGQQLVIWTKTAKAQTTNQGVTRKLSYRVRQGDSLARIADKFNISIRDITRWNSVSTNQYIHPGQSLTLFVDVTKAN
ncbi:LysM peptidoglycan-binding domain-containing protein [Gilvimarinus sp. SDUM040013]|uniref:LysM peptidoglycan-binding domain-containing protein n=1 Tax=Gilvimarinus gilvus TaxID=3058038 RepID=A0ABU4RWS5_9GAMM|nr:LysM peptidoglycan-binding domain-containing protein [Gilvimarinus sp. SDUM040013]MDO3385691.1 LysM peptidoglycan-binding domain-containing protein [Gilvimarinus sp. SDUM040013]MDX6849329.1 LysM peptidoglycan-binding domain-containing protein [Gilvimarinus sp. SDUM040013]